MKRYIIKANWSENSSGYSEHEVMAETKEEARKQWEIGLSKEVYRFELNSNIEEEFGGILEFEG